MAWSFWTSNRATMVIATGSWCSLSRAAVGQTIIDGGNVAFPDAQAIEGKPSLRFANSDHFAPQARHQALHDEAKLYLLPICRFMKDNP